MKRVLLLALALILALPVFAHADEITGFFMTPATQIGTQFPGVPQWDDVAASEDSAALFTALLLMDMEEGCAQNGYEVPSGYDKVYLWVQNGTVYVTVYADISFSMFVMNTGELMVLMAENREVTDIAHEFVAMQLESGEMEDAIHITPEMLEMGMERAASGETVRDESAVSMIYEYGTTWSAEAADTEFEVLGSLTETSAEFPELPAWEKLNGIPAFAAQYAKALIADFERICEIDGIAIPGDYSTTYLVNFDDDTIGVGLLVFGEVSYIITAPSGVLLAFTLEEDMQGKPAEEILPMLLESGDIADYCQVAVSSSTYVPDNSQGEGVGAFTVENYMAMEFLIAYSRENLLADENLAAEMARFVIEDLETGCADNGYAAPAGYDRVFLWTTADGTFLTVYSQMSYAVLLQENQMVVIIAINEYVAQHAHEHMAYMQESGQLIDYLYIPEHLIFGTEAPSASSAPAATAPERSDDLPAMPARFTCAADTYNSYMAPPIRWSNVAGDEDTAAGLAEIILSDAVMGLADYGFESEAVEYIIIRGIKDVPVLYVSMGGGMWMLMPSSTGMTVIWTPDHPAADGDPAEFAENAMESEGVYYILTGEGILTGQTSVPTATGTLPDAGTEYSIPATVTLLNMPYRTGWEDIADDPYKVALMAASILEDAEAGLAEYGFDEEKADYFILFDMVDFPVLYVSMDGGLWSFLPGSDAMTARWMSGHNAAGADPYDFAEWSLDNGMYDAYFVLTAEEIANGHGLAAENAALRAGEDWVAKFRMADKVYNYNSGYAPFVYQQQAAFISPAGEVLLAGEIDGARVFDDYGFAPVYQGPYTAGIAYGGLWGLADTEGNIVLPIEYSGIERTDDGLYSVPVEGGRGFFDPETGEFHTVTGFGEVAWQCSNGLIPVAYAYVDETGSETGEKVWGFANLQGELVIPCEFDSVSYTWTGGCANVQKDGKYGLINGAGELIIPCEWDGFKGIGEGFAVMVRNLPPQEGLTQRELKEFVVVDFDGNEVTSFVAYTVDVQKVPGYIAVYMSFENQGGLYRITGEEVLPMEYYDIYMYSETQVLLAQKDENGESHHGIYDMEAGAWLSEMQWDNRVLLRGGFCRVEKDGLFGYLNGDFEPVIPVQYEDASDFSDGYALVKKDGAWMFIDEAGQPVF